MHLRTTLACLFMLQGSLALELHEHAKRGAETNATLFAYGTNSSVWPISYSVDDGLLYVAENPSNEEANLTPVTWDLASITGECWIANATMVNGTNAGSMYIMDKEDYAVAGVVYNNHTLLEAQFWAKATDYDGVYSLMWTLDDDEPNGDFPVVVKASEDST